MLRVGDIIRINDPRALYHGGQGTIVQVRPGDSFPYQVQMKTSDDEGETIFWFTAEEIAPEHDDHEHPYDFSHSGLGIGGLSSYVEPLTIPSNAALERYEQMTEAARTCLRCGQTDVFDGAMFTNGSSDICDDCFG